MEHVGVREAVCNPVCNLRSKVSAPCPRSAGQQCLAQGVPMARRPASRIPLIQGVHPKIQSYKVLCVLVNPHLFHISIPITFSIEFSSNLFPDMLPKSTRMLSFLISCCYYPLLLLATFSNAKELQRNMQIFKQPCVFEWLRTCRSSQLCQINIIDCTQFGFMFASKINQHRIQNRYKNYIAFDITFGLGF